MPPALSQRPLTGELRPVYPGNADRLLLLELTSPYLSLVGDRTRGRRGNRPSAARCCSHAGRRNGSQYEATRPGTQSPGAWDPAARGASNASASCSGALVT
jgi:hypothetical protein